MEISWLVSGERITVLDPATFQGNTVKTLKQFLAVRVGASRFRQQMFFEGTEVEMDDFHLLGSDPLKIQLLVLDFVYPNREQVQEMTVLAAENRSSELEYRLQDRWNPNVANAEGYTPLQSAVRHDQFHMVQLLLEAGASVNQRTEEVEVPLYIAARRGQVRIVRCLVENGCDRDPIGDEGQTPLCIAAAERHLGVVQSLIGYRANCNLARHDGKTPLFMAAEHGEAHIVNCLAAVGASIDPMDEDGRTPLHAAGMGGYIDVVRRLAELKANINRRTFHRFLTPMFLAAQRDHLHVVRYLALLGADIDEPTLAVLREPRGTQRQLRLGLLQDLYSVLRYRDGSASASTWGSL